MSVLVSVLMAAATSSASSDCDRLAAHPEDPQRVTPGVTQDAIDYPVAIRICETAVAKEPENARLRYQLARLLFYTNQTQRAVEEMKRSADDNHNAGAIYLRHLRGSGATVCAERYLYCRALLAQVAAREDPASWYPSGPSVLNAQLSVSPSNFGNSKKCTECHGVTAPLKLLSTQLA